MSDKVSIRGLSKAAVLAALYNASHPQGLGFLHYDEKPMTEAEAAQTIKERGLSFDYLMGRVMKVDISKDSFDPWLFDRDNFPGAAQKAINALRATGDANAEEIEHAHLEGTRNAAEIVENNLGDKSTVATEGSMITLNLGIDEFAEPLRPIVGKILDESGDSEGQ